MFACSEYLLVFVYGRRESYLDLLHFGGSEQLLEYSRRKSRVQNIAAGNIYVEW
jgi:hypothetical protein